MKKFALLAVVLILTLGALALPAAAQQRHDLTTLTQYFPADAPVYVGFRTDDAFIQTVDGLVAKIGTVLPGANTTSLQKALDQAAAMMQPGGTFATTIRTWMGDSGAVGVFKLQAQDAQHPVPAITIALAITDQDKAEAYFKTLPNAARYTRTQGTGYTLYSPKSSDTNSSDPYFVFRSDILLITGDETLVQSGGVLASKLGDNPDFNTAVEMLPAPSYSVVAYLDTPSILTWAMQQQSATSMTSGNAAMKSMFSSILSALKPQAIGLTLLDNRALTLDVASPLNANASGPLTLMTTHHPVDPAFVERIPAGTPLVVHGTDLFDSYKVAIANLRALAQMMPESANLRSQDVETGLWGLGFLVRGLTGLEVDDAIGWMTGDYTLSLGFTPAFSDSNSIFSVAQQLPVDFGVTIAATDAAAAQKVFDGLTRSLSGLPAQNITVAQETLDGGAKALTFTVTSPEMPSPIELMAATGNGVFAFGTRRMVTAAVNPQKGGMSGDTSFVDAEKYLLNDPDSIFFLSGTNLLPLANVMTGSANPQDVRQQGKQLRLLLGLVNSISVSRAVLADNAGSVTRFVWTLPE